VTYRLEPLADHDLGKFTCGNDTLDDWLHRHAHTATGHGTRTYVLVGENSEVVGYVAIAPHHIVRTELPPRIARGASERIPAILLAKLALDASLHGQGLGSELLVRALETILDAARLAGGRLVVVDAVDEAAIAFYTHHDFQPVPGHTHRLVMKLSTAAKALGQDWP